MNDVQKIKKIPKEKKQKTTTSSTQEDPSPSSSPSPHSHSHPPSPPPPPSSGELIEEKNECILKKRGRKPKGGKLKIQSYENTNKPNNIANIILHLKCSESDLNNYNNNINTILTNPLEYKPTVPPNILTYENKNFCFYENINTESTNAIDNYAYSIDNIKMENYHKSNNEPEINEINMKDINLKLKKLKINLYKNTNIEKSSACFWCTYDYDNPPCLIPKYETPDVIYGYGSFCRPECAVAYLMKEIIDDTVKFERYFLLNKIYGKVYGHKKNIKPAPSPHYLLDKFYGNLSIQEYRKLLKTEHMLLVLDKPMTRILPELHEDNEEIKLNIKGINNGNGLLSSSSTNTGFGIYKVKRQSEKTQGPSKASIFKENFGL
jgi:hypothetical protein